MAFNQKQLTSRTQNVTTAEKGEFGSCGNEWKGRECSELVEREEKIMKKENARKKEEKL